MPLIGDIHTPLAEYCFFLQPAGDLPEGIIVPPPVNGTDEDYADYIDSQQDSFRSGGPVQANASPDFDNNPDQVGGFLKLGSLINLEKNKDIFGTSGSIYQRGRQDRISMWNNNESETESHCTKYYFKFVR